MDPKDQQFIDTLIKDQKTSLKKRRLNRNLYGIFILLSWPILAASCIGLSNKYNLEILIQNQFFLLGFSICLFTVVPIILLGIHLSDNGNYDDLKKDDLIVQLYDELNEKNNINEPQN